MKDQKDQQTVITDKLTFEELPEQTTEKDVKKYAEHHVEEQSELVKYLGDPTGTVTAELQGLSEKHLVAIINNNNKLPSATNKRYIKDSLQGNKPKININTNSFFFTWF